jgi:hypothetical protein
MADSPIPCGSLNLFPRMRIRSLIVTHNSPTIHKSRIVRSQIFIFCLLSSVFCLLSLTSNVAAQTRRPPARRPAPAKPVVAPADLTCPTLLGVGVTSKRSFCDILTGRDPAEGATIKFPAHRGPLTLRFDLHNRHTYSEEEVKAKRGYSLYTATIGALTLDNTLIARAVVRSEFRKREDLLDRVAGGAGGSVKAVAPIGLEPIVMTIPEEVDAVSFLGEKLEVLRIDGPATYSAPGRPIAVISNLEIEYTPAPVKGKR